MPPSSRLRLQDAEVATVLKECCDLNLEALLTSVAPGQSVKAQFSSVTADALELNLVDSGRGPFLASSACVVTYSFKGKVYLFLSVIRESTGQETPDQDRIEMALPDNIALADLRAATRVPVAEGCGLQAHVEVSMYATERSKVLDISKTGVLLEYEPGATPDIAEGDIAKITLTMGDQVAEYTTELRHMKGGRCGFMFIEPDEPIDAVQQEEALQEILEDVNGHTELRHLGGDQS